MAQSQVPNISVDDLMKANSGGDIGGAINAGVAGYQKGLDLKEVMIKRKMEMQKLQMELEKQKQEVAEKARQGELDQIIAKNINKITPQTPVKTGLGDATLGTLGTPTPAPEALVPDAQGADATSIAGTAFTPDIPSMELSRQATLDSASAERFPKETLFGSTGKAFEQQTNFDITDPKTGQKRTVKAILMHDGAYHPLTRQKVDDLSELPDAGFKQSISMVGRNPNTNMPVEYNTQTNTYTSGGQLYTGVVFPKLENAPASTIDALANYSTSKDTLRLIVNAYQDEKVGPIAGRYATLQEWAGTNTPEAARFMSLVRSYQNSMIKAITGAQMSEPEAVRLLGQMPTFKDNPAAFVSKLQAAAEQADIAMANRLRIAEAGGYAIQKGALNESQASDLVTRHFGLESNLDSSSRPLTPEQPSKPKTETMSAKDKLRTKLGLPPRGI